MLGELADRDAIKYCGDDDWETRAENELGLPYFPRRLDPAVRRTLIALHREKQIADIVKLAKKIGLFPK